LIGVFFACESGRQVASGLTPSRASPLVCLDLKGWAGLKARFRLWPVRTVGDFSSRPFYPKRR